MRHGVAGFLGRSRNAISDIHPLVERAVSTAVWYYAAARLVEGRIRGAMRYDASIDPRRLYDVDPNDIERTVSWTRITDDRKGDEHPKFRRPKYLLAGRVFDGEWDRNAERFTDSTIYRSFRAHFAHGVPWTETAFYRETLAAIEAGETPWDCRSRDDLRRRCDRLDALYERIDADGYRTQEELYERGERDVSGRFAYRRIWGEIAVNVGRDGTFYFQDGRNRLAIARVSGLDSVPVVILVRHRKWQRKRERIARGELGRMDLPERLRNHPDLLDLL